MFNISVDSLLKNDFILERGDNFPDTTFKKKDKEQKYLKNNQFYCYFNLIMILLGTLGLMILPIIAEYIKLKSMEVYKKSFTNSLVYLSKFPLNWLFILSLTIIIINLILFIKNYKKK